MELTRRLKILGVGRNFLFEAIRRCKAFGTYSAGCRCIPKDAIVREVHENYSHGTIDFMIEHPSFDEAVDGAVLPRIYCNCQLYGATLSMTDNGPLLTIENPTDTDGHLLIEGK